MFIVGEGTVDDAVGDVKSVVESTRACLGPRAMGRFQIGHCVCSTTMNRPVRTRMLPGCGEGGRETRPYPIIRPFFRDSPTTLKTHEGLGGISFCSSLSALTERRLTLELLSFVASSSILTISGVIFSSE